jgi:simple sugar transport system ATP-binding protein
VLRKGKCIGTVDVKNTNKDILSEMMVGRKVEFVINKKEKIPGKNILEVQNLVVQATHKNKNIVDNVSFYVRSGEIVCIAGIDGNGQIELAYSITGLEKIKSGKIKLNGIDITNYSINKRNKVGIAHIPEDRHKHGLILDFPLERNMVLKKFNEKRFQKYGFIKNQEVRKYSNELINKYDIRSSLGPITSTRTMSGGNQQKAIIARELDLDPELLVSVQPTRGLDIGAIEYIHKQIIEQRNLGRAVLLISLELDEVMNLSDRILVMYEGAITGELNPKKITINELGLYMSGSKKDVKISG